MMTSISHPVFTAIVFVSVLVARGESGARQRARIMIVIETRGLSSSSYPPFRPRRVLHPVPRSRYFRSANVCLCTACAGTSSYDEVPRAACFSHLENVRTCNDLYARKSQKSEDSPSNAPARDHFVG